MELEKLKFYDTNIILNCKIINENNLSFKYTLNDTFNPGKQINYYNIRNKKIYNDLKKDKDLNNLSLSNSVYFKNQKSISRNLSIPYSENYFDTERLNSMIREYNNITVGNEIDDFIAYLEQLSETSIKNEIDKFLKDEQYKISDDFYYSTSGFSIKNRNKSDNIQKLILTTPFNEKTDFDIENISDGINRNDIDSFTKLQLLAKNVIYLLNDPIQIKGVKKEFIKKTNFKNKLKEILEKINIHFGESIRKETSNVYMYLNNYINLFLPDSKIESKNQNIIRELFIKLESNLNKNKDLEQYSEYKDKGKFFEKIPKYNIPSEQNKILSEFSKYFYSLESLKGLDEKDLLEKIKSDENISNIITYHNIYKILKLLLLPDTIILLDNLQESKTGKKIRKYCKVTKFEPTFINKFIIEKTENKNMYLNCIFNIELEKISTESKIIFRTQMIDYLNNNLNERVEEKNNTLDIDNLHNDKYKNYGTSIFEIKNSENTIFIGKLDYEKILGNFNYIKKTSPLFKNLKVVNAKEIFLNNKLFTYFYNNNKYKKNITSDTYFNKIIENYYIDKFLFKKSNILKIDSNNIKYGKIVKTKIKPYNSNNFRVIKNNDIRLSIDDSNDNYEVYLDVYVLNSDTKEFIKNPKQDLYIKTGCFEKANKVDNIFKKLFNFENTHAKNLLISTTKPLPEKKPKEVKVEKKPEEVKVEKKPEGIKNDIKKTIADKAQNAGKNKLNKNTKKKYKQNNKNNKNNKSIKYRKN